MTVSERVSGLTKRRGCDEREIELASLRYRLKREREGGNGYSLKAVEVEGHPDGIGMRDLRVNGLDQPGGDGSDMRRLAISGAGTRVGSGSLIFRLNRLGGFPGIIPATFRGGIQRDSV